MLGNRAIKQANSLWVGLWNLALWAHGGFSKKKKKKDCYNMSLCPHIKIVKKRPTHSPFFLAAQQLKFLLFHRSKCRGVFTKRGKLNKKTICLLKYIVSCFFNQHPQLWYHNFEDVLLLISCLCFCHLLCFFPSAYITSSFLFLIIKSIYTWRPQGEKNMTLPLFRRFIGTWSIFSDKISTDSDNI